jgi:hypothetical protein
VFEFGLYLNPVDSLKESIKRKLILQCDASREFQDYILFGSGLARKLLYMREQNKNRADTKNNLCISDKVLFLYEYH